MTKYYEHKSLEDIIIHKHVRELTEEDLEDITRGGIVPYRSGENELNGPLFLFGIDAHYNEITDFGGRFEKEIDIDVIDTAIREFHEESLGIFGPIKRESIQHCIVFVNKTKHMLIIMIHIPLPVKQTVELFDKVYQIKKQNEENVEKIEVKALKWLTTRHLANILNNEISKTELHMYSLVKEFFKAIGNNLTMVL